MKFHLNLNVKPAPFELHYEDILLFEGSCFSDHIFENLKALNLPVFSNTFGNIYHPQAINQILLSVLNQEQIPTASYINRDSDRYCSFYTHGKINACDVATLKQTLEQLQHKQYQILQKAKVFFITWGSAWAYLHATHGFICANCHKQPSSSFSKQLSHVQDIVHDTSSMLHKLKALNPELQIVFTVSPVKHLRDGIHENVLSKSVLHVALHELIQNHPELYYFPSFEWIQEDLRDYRFYNADLAHPNALAVNYVWDKFKTTFYNKAQQDLLMVIEDYQKSKHHISQKQSNAEIEHQDKLLKKIKSMAPLWLPNAH